jgi:hypothetical protein
MRRQHYDRRHHFVRGSAAHCKKGSNTNVSYLCCNPCAVKHYDRRHLFERPPSSFGARSSAHWEKEAASPMCHIFVVIHAPVSFATVLIIWSAVISAFGKEGSITNVPYL